MSALARILAAAALASVLAGCPKDENKNAPPAPADAAPAAPADAAPAEAGPATAPDAPVTFSGKYTSAPAKLYIPEDKDWSRVSQAKDDPSKAVGEGELTVEAKGGTVSGTIDSGPLAPAVVEGVLANGEIRANVRRKDPTDQGLTGVLVAKVEGDGATGTLSLANANAETVREAKVSLKKK